MKKAIVLLSGGQDSTYCAAWALKAGFEVHAIGMDYGQRHSKELASAKKIAQLLDIPFERIFVDDALRGNSPLVDGSELEQYATFEEMQAAIGSRIEVTSVPLRNMLFATVAANRAAVIGAEVIVMGACKEDAANYPDCRLQFFGALDSTIRLALGMNPNGMRPRLFALPLIEMSKAEMIRDAYRMNLHHDELRDSAISVATLWAFTQTSYAGDYPPLDRNHANVLREQGFREARLPDPLILRAVMEGLMPLPSEEHYQDADWNLTITAGIRSLKERLK